MGTPTSGGPTGGDPVGSLADELARLLDALTARAASATATTRPARDGGAGSGEPDDGVPGHRARGDRPAVDGPGHERTGAEVRCRGCPLCRLLDVLHGAATTGAGPQVRTPLVDAVGTALATLRDFASAPVPRERAGPPRHPPPRTPSGGLVRIDIT